MLVVAVRVDVVVDQFVTGGAFPLAFELWIVVSSHVGIMITHYTADSAGFITH